MRPAELTAELRGLLLAAAKLADDIAGQHRREQAAFADGYRLGFGAGRQVGHRAAHHDLERADAAYSAKLRALHASPAYSELEALRYPGYTPERLHELRQGAIRRLLPRTAP